MYKIITLLLLSALISCSEDEGDKIHYTSIFPLKQLVQDEVTSKSSHGGFFLIGGSYSSSEKTEDFVKVFAKVEDNYRVITIPLRNLRININDSLTVPTLQIKYEHSYPCTDEYVCDIIECCGYTHKYIISCPEIYLPTKLIPITL